MPLDTPQWQKALEKGNTTRVVMSELRGEIRQMNRADGRREVARILRENDERAQALKVGLLLKTPHRMGETYTRTILTRANVSGETRVRNLTDMERQRLVDQIDPGLSSVPTPRPKPKPVVKAPKPAAAPRRRSEPVRTVPVGPFVDWLQQRYVSPTEATEMLSIPKQPVLDAWNGRIDVIKEDIVDRALLDQWETLDDLYPLETAA